MRATGQTERATGFGLSDHLCWGYTSRNELAQIGVEWLAEGVRLGQRIVYVADRTRDELLDDLGGLDDRDALVVGGTLLVFTVPELYDLSKPIDAVGQLQTYAGSVDQAIAAGYNGVRVLADITRLVIDPERRDAHVFWEHYADRYMVDHPLAALCAYDVAALGRAAAPIACVHPVRHVPDDIPPFSLHAGPAGVALQGEIDSFGADTLANVLAALPADLDAVDISGLEFLDGRSAALLAGAASSRAASGSQLRLEHARPGVQALWAALRLDPEVIDA